MFVEFVVPNLQKRGVFRSEYEANTLRGNLQLLVEKYAYKAQEKVLVFKRNLAENKEIHHTKLFFVR